MRSTGKSISTHNKATGRIVYPKISGSNRILLGSYIDRSIGRATNIDKSKF